MWCGVVWWGPKLRITGNIQHLLVTSCSETIRLNTTYVIIISLEIPPLCQACNADNFLKLHQFTAIGSGWGHRVPLPDQTLCQRKWWSSLFLNESIMLRCIMKGKSLFLSRSMLLVKKDLYSLFEYFYCLVLPPTPCSSIGIMLFSLIFVNHFIKYTEAC